MIFGTGNDVLGGKNGIPESGCIADLERLSDIHKIIHCTFQRDFPAGMQFQEPGKKKPASGDIPLK